MLDAFEGVTYELSDDPVAVLALASPRDSVTAGSARAGPAGLLAGVRRRASAVG